ncbi:MAG: hypothetical protein ACKVOG_11990 [Rhodoglobus sp.]
MASDTDDDALAWSGETDSSHVDGPAAAPPATRRPVAERVEAPVAESTRAQTPAALLITYGILGGVYLIYTLGWVTSILRLNGVRAPYSDPLAEIMFQLGEGLALASPALWLAAVFLLTRGRKPLVRLAWILVGLVAVLPWPFVLGAWA